ncbi:RsmB/NOP family class I SAM-dependent RNA methyltransferase [Paenibacillus apiarius]|uniref:RsmB/NOP family class I SAM-dependent RNA methyltransferase n=2 Tax=Paenibacillus apiarius TaxID=46240 RepID=A0ABT4E011_9BACL|nr:RsmB/NOP family class I SAM-dependent RNA methyltransferase [Paenibacillus apiarius]MCY9515061.1 RsmB/NOP family class I SAM-dependent RNA methyltransferase [Paenibacillus apiarius]MCY9522953.1 RsmB/NOP family class I SAM-dependent RNA methyltransferase [Paenibacillus apiarius]MCY9553756.1 RsmB/NOP family class I SAM-dependent RNA methyltransferase [Paenibacillus apiarius]MCY9556411.1 RsmB/NOP family class I SAM-dependent RNA methyltransferase [Paenibacillus apiarius]MCY9684845.1 RsmB/NOP f
MKSLPTAFVQTMQKRLGEQFEEFMKSYSQEPHAGIRANGLKLDAAALQNIVPYPLRPIPWTTDGFYISNQERPGKHPYYHAGLYYIQEPSAMAPVECLDVRPHDRVLDLCAAPGGKSVQIAARLGEDGVLVTNDIHPDRTKALVRNIELYGVRHAVVLNERPERIAEAFPGCFTKVLVDAPCSGEGMFRKEPDMVKSWEREPVLTYAKMQQDIMNSAANLVAPGGRLVYSTCTFSPEENEASIARFLSAHPEFRVVPIPLANGFCPGRPDWARECMKEYGWEADEEAIDSTAGTARLWPHRLQGEGHFVAVLERSDSEMAKGQRLARAELHEQAHHGDNTSCVGAAVMNAHPSRQGAKGQKPKHRSSQERLKQGGSPAPKPKGILPPASDQLEAYGRFCREQMTAAVAGANASIGPYLYACPLPIQRLGSLRVVRPGLFLGTCKGERFEPAQALAMAMTSSHMKRVLPLRLGQDEVNRYLRGETLTLGEEHIERDPATPAKGWLLVCVDGYSLGLAKWAGGTVKNEYPPAWRWT